MNGADVLDIAREAIWTLLLVAGPIMAIGLFVGLAIALFQALTQIQEMTLTFVPKILAIFAALIVLLPFMGSAMQHLMTLLADRIVAGG